MQPWFDYPISHGFFQSFLANVGDTPHFAVDLAVPQDTPITTPYSGTVAIADYPIWSGQPGGGEVFIKSPNIPGGQEWYVYHLDQIAPGIVPGAQVVQGEEIGLSGGQNTGGSHPTGPEWSSGPHVHTGFFSGFVSTPVGSRPEGTDITPFLQQWGQSSFGEQIAVPPQNTQTGSDATPNLSELWFQKSALFLVAVLFILAGFFLLFKKQISAFTQKGVKVAEEVAIAA